MKKEMYSIQIANAINTFLTEDDWHFTFHEQRGIFKFGLRLSGKIKRLQYTIYVREEEFVVYALSPFGADEEDPKMMAAMAEFVCRANYGLKNGNFECDMRDGEIRFKCFVDCADVEPSPQMIRNSIYCPAAMFERYGEGIMGIIFGIMNAEEATEKCEKSSAADLRSLLEENVGEGGDVDAMIAHLAERFGLQGGSNE